VLEAHQSWASRRSGFWFARCRCPGPYSWLRLLGERRSESTPTNSVGSFSGHFCSDTTFLGMHMPLRHIIVHAVMAIQWSSA